MAQNINYDNVELINDFDYNSGVYDVWTPSSASTRTTARRGDIALDHLPIDPLSGYYKARIKYVNGEY